MHIIFRVFPKLHNLLYNSYICFLLIFLKFLYSFQLFLFCFPTHSLHSQILLYYEKEGTCVIELPEYLDEWTAPLLFTSYVKKKIYTIPRDISFLWVKERVIPSGRQNINDILAHHNMQSYDEMKFLEISEGKCSQDSLYIKKIDMLPDFVIERQKKNIVECVLSDDHTLLCFFEDDTIKKIQLEDLQSFEEQNKIINNEQVYQSGKVGTGGYCVTFNESIDLPAWLLYDEESNIPLNLNDFKVFLKNNVLDTTESCDLLECSRQNMSYMVRKQQLTPVKEEVRGNLYLKGDVLRTLW